MLIRYIFGPRAGETEHMDRVSAKPLISAAIAEAVNPKDLEPDGFVRPYGEPAYRLPRAGDAIVPEPKWSIDYVQMVVLVTAGKPHPPQPFLCIRMDIGGQHLKWWGDPRNAGSARFGRPIPANILAAYKKAWKDNEDLRAPQPDNPQSDENEKMAAKKASMNRMIAEAAPRNLALLLAKANEEANKD